MLSSGQNKTKSQKVLKANSCVCKSYKEKTGSWDPPPLPPFFMILRIPLDLVLG